MSKMFEPSSEKLNHMIASAEAKFAADRKRALEERAERARRLNAHQKREAHESYLIQMPRARGFRASSV